MNILILSCGTRNKVLQYFKESLQGLGSVVATDCSELAPALYEADRYYILPRITEEGYVDKVLDICKKERINGIISLIDPELSLLAKHSDEFLKVGTVVIGSPYDVCERSLNKYEMYKWLYSNNYMCAKSYMNVDLFYNDLDRGNIDFPVFVKPYKGSASAAISKINNKETFEIIMKNSENLMVQQYLNGQEIGADVYVDMHTKEVVSIFTKKKIVMRAGETDKSVSFIDESLFILIEKFVKEFGFVGQIDIDIFEVNGKYYISEVNPRFGGGYPHAHECGVNHVNLIINNLQGNINKKCIGNYKENIHMMKYNEILVK